MSLPDSVAELVERFEASRSEDHKGHHNFLQAVVVKTAGGHQAFAKVPRGYGRTVGE